MRNFKTCLLAAAAALALSGTAMAADPTYTSQIGEAFSAVNVTNIVTDVGAFLGVIFTLVLVSVGYRFVSNRLNHSVK